MELLKQHFSKIRIPENGAKVYKDECVYSFDTPESDGGLFVCLNTFLGFGKDSVSEYSKRTNNCVFLNIKHSKIELPPENEAEPDKKIARLAIGVEGGFNPDAGKKKFRIEESNSLIILPDFHSISLPNPDLPEIVQQSISGILKAEPALHLADVEATALAWDGELRQVARCAEALVQLDNGRKIPPYGWKCEKCDMTENLWLNLTDGMILCGRRQLDGSGGNNHALEHYHKTGYPLAVKLGTITSDGKADVYSYNEDDMVLDPHLEQHLAHFGINVMNMQKTEKTMIELEIDYNQRAWEWSRLTESGTKLVPKFGPGYTGLKNLGNSCYLNSVMQLLMTVPSFSDTYYKNGHIFMEAVAPLQSPDDFNVQMTKLANGLLSGKYSKAPEVTDESEDQDQLQPGISPLMFRTHVGKGHQEFSTKRQQDAMEFLEHMLKMVSRHSRKGTDAGHCFKFEVEDKFECTESKKVRYVNREDLYLPLPVPLEEAANKHEVAAYQARRAEAQAKNMALKEEQIHSKVPFSACLSKFVAPEEIQAFSSAVGKEVTMYKVTRLTTFPNFLIIQLVKFGIGPDWQPYKYDVSVDMPLELDLSVLKGYGHQPDEELMPDDSPKVSKSELQIDAGVVNQLAEMGFPEEACKKAVYLTGNSGLEAAMNWVMEHIEDADFSTPITMGSKNASFTPTENGLAMLMSMGFSQDQATLALKETNNDLERAADWIFSHQTQLDLLVAADKGQSAKAEDSVSRVPVTDGPPRYELVAFLSHMGTSIYVGHYVCHIKKDGEWTIFNDNKVSKSVDPPKDLGYIYLYKRISQ